MITTEADVHNRYRMVESSQGECHGSYCVCVHVRICRVFLALLHCENYTVSSEYNVAWSLHNPSASECGRFVAPVK